MSLSRAALPDCPAARPRPANSDDPGHRPEPAPPAPRPRAARRRHHRPRLLRRPAPFGDRADALGRRHAGRGGGAPRRGPRLEDQPLRRPRGPPPARGPVCRGASSGCAGTATPTRSASSPSARTKSTTGSAAWPPAPASRASRPTPDAGASPPSSSGAAPRPPASSSPAAGGPRHGAALRRRRDRRGRRRRPTPPLMLIGLRPDSCRAPSALAALERTEPSRYVDHRVRVPHAGAG